MKKLNIGCGSDIKQDYINIDIRNLDGVDIVSDISSLEFEPESIQEIYCSDFLEHFKKEEAFEILQKFHIWLCKDGILDIRVPDLQAVATTIIEQPLFEAMVERIYGGQDYNTNYHYWGWTPQSFEKFIQPLHMTQIHEEFASWNMRFKYQKC